MRWEYTVLSRHEWGGLKNCLPGRSHFNTVVRRQCLVGFTTAADRQRIDAFIRRGIRADLDSWSEIANFEQIEESLKKVCHKVSLCENCQRQGCRAFIGLTIHTKIIGGGVLFYLKFWVKVTALERNRRF